MPDVELFGNSAEPVEIGLKTGVRTVNPDNLGQWSYQLTEAEEADYAINEIIKNSS